MGQGLQEPAERSRKIQVLTLNQGSRDLGMNKAEFVISEELGAHPLHLRMLQ